MIDVSLRSEVCVVVSLRFPHKTMFGSSLPPVVFVDNKLDIYVLILATNRYKNYSSWNVFV